MTPNSFIDWLKGFLTGKESLSTEEMKSLKETLDTVQEPIQLTPNYPPVTQPLDWVDPSKYPSYNNVCPYPDNCGMPTVWHGVVPPTCSKCGKNGDMPTIVYCEHTGNPVIQQPFNTISADGSVSQEEGLDNSHITGDLNESQD